MSSLSTSLQFGLGGSWLAEHTLRTVGAGLAVFDRLGRVAQVDERAADLLSLAEGEPLGMRLDHPRWEAIHLDGQPLDERSDPVRSALATESASVADVVGVITDEGDTAWLAVTALPLPGLDGSTQAALVSFVDVTGIIRDRAAVDSAEAVGRSAFDHGAAPKCIIDDTGRLLDWNRAFAEFLDRPDYELIATPIDRWIDAERSIVVEETSAAVAVTPGRWRDGDRVVVRSWRSGRTSTGRTMVELTPPAWSPDAH